MNISNVETLSNFRLSSFHSLGVSWLYPFTAMCRSAFSISDFRTICLPNITPIHLFQNGTSAIYVKFTIHCLA